jgi:hypothetical protein
VGGAHRYVWPATDFFQPRLGAAAIALGAIVAPPDAVAANEVLRHLRIPQRIGLVLQGESMLNDATAPTRSENITVTWRRSARSSGGVLAAAGPVSGPLEGPGALASLRGAAIASSSLSR